MPDMIGSLVFCPSAILVVFDEEEHALHAYSSCYPTRFSRWNMHAGIQKIVEKRTPGAKTRLCHAGEYHMILAVKERVAEILFGDQRGWIVHDNWSEHVYVKSARPVSIDASKP